MTRGLRPVAAILLFGMGLGLTTASTQNYPERTIKFIMPDPAGSPVDAGARVIAQDLKTWPALLAAAGIKAQ